MSDFLVAIGLAIAIEGILYALFPEGMKRMLMQVLSMPQSAIRTTGITIAMIGVLIVWLVKGQM
jgi:uncharacterized protein YjeT (DUF2065 family)